MSKIQWTEKVWNPVTGCPPVSAGCTNYYAATMTRRLDGMGKEKYQGLIGDDHFNGVVRCHEESLSIPLMRRNPTMYFVNSMSDLFHEDVSNGFIADVFAHMSRAHWHQFQVLTKRPERASALLMCDVFAELFENSLGIAQEVAEEILADRGDFDVLNRRRGDIRSIDNSSLPLPNVWLGTSVEDQKSADERIPHLLRCPAAVRFLSCEPLLSEIEIQKRSLRSVFENHTEKWTTSVHWVIVGGESGPSARECRVGWVRSVVDQCRAASVPCFVKQLGEFAMLNGERLKLQHTKGGDPAEWPEDLRVREMPETEGAALEVK